MMLWAQWARSSLYLTDFLKDLDWEVSKSKRRETVTVSYEGQKFWTVARPDMACFKDQLTLVRACLDQRPDRMLEILSELGYPTPYFMMILGLQAAPNRYTLELITATQVLT